MSDHPSHLTGFLHAGLLVSNLQTACTFYESVLGLIQVPRPELPYPGAWYALGSQQLHLMQLPNPDQTSVRPAHGGRDRHIAFGVTDIETLKARLVAKNVEFTQSRSGRAALFCRDPDGNTLEFVQI